MESAFESLARLYDSYITRIENTIANLKTIEPENLLDEPEPERERELELELELESNPAEKKTYFKSALAEQVAEQLIEDFAMEIIFGCHRDAKQTISTCPLCLTKCRAYVDLPGVDIFGQDSAAGSNDPIECVNCKREYPYSRYAAHMDKCMGLSSRRTTSRRSAATSSVSTPINSMILDVSTNDADKKRKLFNGDSSLYPKKRGK